MRVLGIDPGTATTGFGVIDCEKNLLKFVDAGIISTKAGVDMPDRLVTIYKELSQLIKLHKPQIVAVEQLFFARNVTTGISVGQSRGIVLLAAAQAKLEIVEFTPLQVKMAVTGYGRADKKQVQEMVKTLLRMKAVTKPDDAADALAIAIAAAHSAKL